MKMDKRQLDVRNVDEILGLMAGLAVVVDSKDPSISRENRLSSKLIIEALDWACFSAPDKEIQHMAESGMKLVDKFVKEFEALLDEAAKAALDKAFGKE